MSTPEFCPNPHCVYHPQEPECRPAEEKPWYRRAGCYHTAAFGNVQRYQCRFCRLYFSEQTFELDYHVKRPVSYRRLFEQITGGSGLRGTGRCLKVGHQAITNRIGRLARQAMALQARLSAELFLQEDLATDGFESFVTDQYMPNNIHTLVGADSQFLYALDYAHLRRKGGMSEQQKAERTRREGEYLRNPVGVRRSFMRIVDEVEQLLLHKRRGEGAVVLDSDEKLEYRWVIEDSEVLRHLKRQGKFVHRRTNSQRPRTRKNPLFPVNYLDRQIRKDNANHVRETVQFSRDVNNCMERMAVYQLYHNYFKPFRVEGLEKRKLRHGEVAGIPRESIERELEDIFSLRRFYSHVKLNFSQLLLWARMIGNRDRFCGGYEPRYVWM